MPKKTKKFIDKKRAVKFSLVHRSQTDGLKENPNHSDLVLQPVLRPGQDVPLHLGLDPTCVDYSSYGIENSPEEVDQDGEQHGDEEEWGEEGDEEWDAKSHTSSKSGPKRRVLEYDRWQEEADDEERLPHDYDYNRHLKPMGGGFFQPAKDVVVTAHDMYGLAPKHSDEKDLDEKFGGQLFPAVDPEQLAREVPHPRIQVTHDFFEALEGDAEGFDELEDDFIVQAMQEGPEDEAGEGEGEEEEEEEEEHASAPPPKPAKSQKLPANLPRHEDEDNDEEVEIEEFEEYYEDGEDEEEYDDEEDERLFGVKKSSQTQTRVKPAVTAEEKFLEAQLNKALEEFGDDDWDEEEEEEEEEEQDEEKEQMTKAQMDDAIQEFLAKNWKVPLEKTDRSDEALELTKKALDSLAVKEVEEEKTKDIDAEIMLMLDPPRPESNWDCQSIISTYSNLENHPRLIAEPRSRNSKKVIQLHPKTGLPMREKPKVVAPPPIDEGSDDQESSDEEAQENLGRPRPKKETKEERKARKQAVKEMKKANRNRKKQLKMAFRSEEVNQNLMFAHQKVHNPQGVRI